MSENSRDAAKTQESIPEYRSADFQKPEQSTVSSAFDYLKAGVRLQDMPPEELLRIASRIGNSSFLELLSSSSQINQREIATTDRIPEPSMPDTNQDTIQDTSQKSNRISAIPMHMAQLPMSKDTATATSPFPIARLNSWAENSIAQTMPILDGG